MSSETTEQSRIADERERLRAELQSRSVLLFVTLASIGDAVITTDADGNISFLNPMAETLTGWGLEDAVGLRIEDVFRLVDLRSGRTVDNPVRQALAEVAKTHLPPDTLLVRKDGSRIPIDDSGAPILGIGDEVLGSVLVFRDITDRKLAEQLITYRSELDRMVSRISTGFVTSPVADVDDRIDGALMEIGRFFGADRAYVFLFNPSEATVICSHEWCAEGISPIRYTVIPTVTIPYLTETILGRKHIRLSTLDELPPEAATEKSAWALRGVKTLADVPMSQEDRVLGFIGIESLCEAKPWPEETVNMLYVVGNVFASAMERRDAQRKLDAAREREVEIGSRIQQTLLLSSPPVASSDFEVAALTIPSKGIDGDFYDFLLHPNRSLDVIFGDVMGKGVPAALLSAGAKTEFLRSLSHLLVSSSRGSIPQPADIVNSVHGVLTPQLQNLDSFVTLSYVRFSPQTRKVTVVDCGNTRLLRCAWESGQIDALSGCNVPLGFSRSEVYEDAIYDYVPGDAFLLYSDGVTEARNARGEMFGVERLEKCFGEIHRSSSRSIVDKIREAVIGFVGSTAIADDLTCVCLRIPIDQMHLVHGGEIRVSSSLGELSSIRAFLRGFCERGSACRINPSELNMLELAVNEVASNIMRHSYHGRTDQEIRIQMAEDEDVLRVRLTHRGDPFRGSRRVPAPSFDGLREGGFGLFIISRAVDSIAYGEDPDGNQYVELCKRLQGSGGL
jgi:PAS domain S-box-containing protein